MVQVEQQLEETQGVYEETQKLLKDEVAISNLYAAQLQNAEDELVHHRPEQNGFMAGSGQLNEPDSGNHATKEAPTTADNTERCRMTGNELSDVHLPAAQSFMEDQQVKSTERGQRAMLAKERVEELEADKTELKIKLMDVQKLLREANSQIAVCRKQTSNAETQTVVLQSKHSDLERRATAAGSLIAELRQSNDDFEKQLSRARASLEEEQLRSRSKAVQFQGAKSQPYNPVTTPNCVEQRAVAAESLAEEMYIANLDLERRLQAKEALLDAERKKSTQSQAHVYEGSEPLGSRQSSQREMEQQAENAKSLVEVLRVENSELHIKHEELSNKNYGLLQKLSAAVSNLKSMLNLRLTQVTGA